MRQPASGTLHTAASDLRGRRSIRSIRRRELVKSNKWAEACPKFEASLRYDNALGARLNLANCYEHIGKLASAWGLYRDSADLARRAGDVKRRDYALKKAAALVPRSRRRRGLCIYTQWHDVESASIYQGIQH